jgi:hypothetical protein
MKYILRLLVVIFILPFFGLAAVIAVLKTIFVITLQFAWETGDEWCVSLLLKLNDFMQWLKN